MCLCCIITFSLLLIYKSGPDSVSLCDSKEHLQCFYLTACQMFTGFAKVQVLLLQFDIFSLVVYGDVRGTAGFATDII